MIRTGASEELALQVLHAVTPHIREDMTTRELYEQVKTELKHVNPCFGCRYNLREAILKLGPAGFHFEKYVAAILRAYRYEAMNPPEDLAGACTNHEVDVVASKDGRSIFIEAKFRNNYHDTVELKDTMAAWSRFLDLVDGATTHAETPHFNECWIVTNARFSDRSLQFGPCKGMHLVGWNFPKDMTFANMVDHVALYPITVIDDLTTSELEAFSARELMLCKTVSEIEPHELSERIDISFERATYLVELCGDIVSGTDTKKEHAHR